MFGTVHLDISYSLLLHRVTVNCLACSTYPAKPVRQVHGQRGATFSTPFWVSGHQSFPASELPDGWYLGHLGRQLTAVHFSDWLPNIFATLSQELGHIAHTERCAPRLPVPVNLDQGKGALLNVETVRHLGALKPSSPRCALQPDAP